VSAEAAEQPGARLERAEHVEAGNAAARPVRHAVFNRQDDGRPVERIDQFRGDNADHSAVPALAGHHQHAACADVGIRLDELLGLGQDVLVLGAAARVLGFELSGQCLRLLPHRIV